MAHSLNDPTLQLLANARPADIVLSEAQDIRAEALLQRITNSPATAPAVEAAARPGLRHRAAFRRAIAGLTALTAGLVAFFATASPAAAEQALLKAAAAAGAQPWESGTYFYTRDRWWVGSPQNSQVIITLEDGGPVAHMVPLDRESWVSREQAVYRNSDDPTRVDLGRFPNLEPSDNESQSQPTFGGWAGLHLTWDEVMALPTDTRDLRQRILADQDRVPSVGTLSHRQKESFRLWEAVTNLLQFSPATPELRRALWQVAAGIRGVELLDVSTDSLGRSAVAVELDLTSANWYRETMWFNPSDGSILETEIFDPTAADNYQIVRTVILEQSWVNEAPTPNWINGSGPIVNND